MGTEKYSDKTLVSDNRTRSKSDFPQPHLINIQLRLTLAHELFLIGSCSAAIRFENTPWIIPLEIIQLRFSPLNSEIIKYYNAVMNGYSNYFTEHGFTNSNNGTSLRYSQHAQSLSCFHFFKHEQNLLVPMAFPVSGA